MGSNSLQAPPFGRRRRQSSDASIERKVERTSNQASEDSSWALVSNSYGFALKPPFHTWTSFVQELRRFQVLWKVASGDASVFRFNVFDHGVHNELSDNPRETCNLMSDVTQAHALSKMLEETVRIFACGIRVAHIPFVPPNTNESYETRFVRFDAYNHVDAPLHFHAAAEAFAQQAESPNQVIEPGVTSNSTALAKPVDWSEWLCVRLSLVNGSTGKEDQLILDVSASCFIYHILSSLINFLNSKDLGIPLYELIPRMHVTKDLVPVWHQLRHYGKMHPAEWPIGLNLFKPM